MMKFDSKREKEMFLQETPYYKSRDSYCLGNTEEEAGCILRQIAENNSGNLLKGRRSRKESTVYVGLDNH